VTDRLHDKTSQNVDEEKNNEMPPAESVQNFLDNAN